MTTTTTTTVPATALGPAVGRAERALTRLLLRVLAETGTPEQTWYAFQRLSTFEPGPTVPEFHKDLRDELDLDDAGAAALLDEITTGGLMHTVSDAAGGPARVSLTGAGEARQAQIRASSAVLNAELTGAIDPGALQTTIATLNALIDRARALRTG